MAKEKKKFNFNFGKKDKPSFGPSKDMKDDKEKPKFLAKKK